MEPDPFIDTNVFIHAVTGDAHADECSAVLQALEQGTLRVRLELIVIHELTYALPRFAKQMTRTDVADLVLEILGWPGIVADRAVLVDVVRRWRNAPGLSFADAYLSEVSLRSGVEVYSNNVRELRRQGASVPDPLPSASPP